MKMIVAIIRPDKFEEVQAALVAKDIYLMTVSDVRGSPFQVYWPMTQEPRLRFELAVRTTGAPGPVAVIPADAGPFP